MQLALVVGSKQKEYVHQFFISLTPIIKIVVGSFKTNDELQVAQVAQVVEIESIIASDQVEFERRKTKLVVCNEDGVGDT